LYLYIILGNKLQNKFVKSQLIVGIWKFLNNLLSVD